ncbi:putative domain, di-copper centre [Sesbania bispinosa]|nr:putative domain, di-copper centre [Sesbania bispinosa]
MPPQVVDLNYNIENPIPYDQQVSLNLVTMYKQVVLATTKELFMGMPLRVDVETPNIEDMGAFYSATRDPIFYPYHTNTDRMWEIWKKFGEGRRDYSDDPDWLDSQFFFYYENADLVRVKVRDCIDTTKLGYVYKDVDLPWMNSPPKYTRNKFLRGAKKGGDVFGSKLITKFPLVLDSIITTIVKRPKNLRSNAEKEQEEEVLVIEGIEFGSDKFVKFDVHIDDNEDNLSGPDQTEFVRSFVSVRHGGKGKVNTCFKVGISKVLENLEAQEDEDVVVTLAPKVGKREVIIGSIKIELIPKY